MIKFKPPDPSQVAKTGQRRFLECPSIAFRTLIGAFRGRGDGLGRPRVHSSILGLRGAEISLKKMKINFNAGAPRDIVHSARSAGVSPAVARASRPRHGCREGRDFDACRPRAREWAFSPCGLLVPFPAQVCSGRKTQRRERQGQDALRQAQGRLSGQPAGRRRCT